MSKKMKITAIYKDGIPTGQYQQGDWSHHKDFKKTGGKVFDSYEEFEKEIERFNNYYRGEILVCDKCGKVDINPADHYKKCDPVMEEYRRQSMSHYMEWD